VRFVLAAGLAVAACGKLFGFGGCADVAWPYRVAGVLEFALAAGLLAHSTATIAAMLTAYSFAGAGVATLLISFGNPAIRCRCVGLPLMAGWTLVLDGAIVLAALHVLRTRPKPGLSQSAPAGRHAGV